MRVSLFLFATCNQLILNLVFLSICAPNSCRKTCSLGIVPVKFSSIFKGGKGHSNLRNKLVINNREVAEYTMSKTINTPCQNEAGVIERKTNVNDEEQTNEKGEEKNDRKTRGRRARRRTMKFEKKENKEGNKSFKFGSYINAGSLYSACK